MFQIVDNIAQQRGAHALRAGVDFLYNDDTITFPRAVRGSYTFSSLANFLRRHLQQRRLRADLRRRPRCEQGNTNVGPLRAGRVERHPAADAQPRAALRPAVPRDHRHRHEQRVAAGRLRLDAVRRRATWSCAAAPASSSTACRCGRWPTRCCRPATRPTWPTCGSTNIALTPGAGRRAGIPEHPAGAGAVGDALQPDDHAARPAERLLAPGEPRSRAAGRRASAPSASATRTCAAHGLLMSINQNVPSCVRRRHQQRLPADRRLRQQQPVPVGRRVDLPRAAGVVGASGRPRGGTTGSATRCRRPRTTSASSSSAGRSIRSTCRRTGAGPTTIGGTRSWSRAASTRRWRRRRRRGSTSRHGFQLSALRAGVLGGAVQHHVGR